MRCSVPVPAHIARTALAAGLLLASAATPGKAQTTSTWNLPGGGSWTNAANWNPMTVPNAVDANATFNNAASASNPAQTANRTVTVDAPQTVGSITFNNDAANAFTNSLTTGTGGSLTFDATGSA